MATRTRRDVPPIADRLKLYFLPQRVSAEWREWALEQVRSPIWVVKAAAATAFPVSLALWLGAMFSMGTRFAEQSGLWALMILVFFFAGVLGGDSRRRTTVQALRTGRSVAVDMPLRRWDLFLALGLGAVVVAALFVFA